MFTLVVPPAYGWVVLGAGIGPFITNMYLAGAVMKGRKEYNVQYPNCYATPGYHKNADEFNRIQRSHQNFCEGLDQYIVMTVLGGLKYPIACAVGSIFFFLGSILYQKGYSDTSLDVQTARFKKGGAIKYIGIFISLYSTGALAYSMLTA
ncbi:MAPEG family protein [Nitzschia inconspicua]|uniref:MAPEG family protein n=1 Tax=Nitzschia inconspicua TaxID=303405 RepID=A0A9K3LET1_9STRA|nr:MAPEG family protein [Nitzschia inconspicua]KAG7361114.1 MAPEG family protein [Nitzschia inconspicua]